MGHCLWFVMVRAQLKGSIHGRRRDAREQNAIPAALRSRHPQAVSAMTFYGTKEEIEAMKKKLKELNPNEKP